MRTRHGCLSFLIAGALCACCFGAVDTQRPRSHHKAAVKKPQLPPLPSGPLGPIPQISLESMSAVAPQVSYQDGQLTIVAPNSTLGDILRAVHKLTRAEMEIPPAATERVVTNLGPGPAPVVMAQLLNGSHFNYVLLGSPADSNLLTRVVLVPKSGPDNAPAASAQTAATNAASPPQPVASGNAPETAVEEAADDSTDDNADQNAAEAEQPAAAPAPDNGAIKTPQQLLQEMQQRQLQMQQGQPGGQPLLPGAAIPPQQRPPGTPPDQQ